MFKSCMQQVDKTHSRALFFLITCAVLLSCARIFCAEVCSGALEEATTDGLMFPGALQRTPRNEKLCTDSLLSHFRGKKNQPCKEVDLINLFYKRSLMKKYDCWRTIALLRTDGHNITHNEQDRTFTLCDGKRPVSEGCYKVALWSQLTERSWREESGQWWALALSDQGFDPTISGVESVRLLKKIVNNEPGRGVMFQRRKSLFETVLREGFVRPREDYSNDEILGMKISGDDISVVKQSWEFYKANNPYIEELRSVERLVRKRGLAEHELASKEVCVDGVVSTSGAGERDVFLERRMCVCQYLASKIHVSCSEQELLSKFYVQPCTKDDLLEDIVELIYAGYNIRYDAGRYQYLKEARGRGLGDKGLRVLMGLFKEQPFQNLSVTEQTYALYAKGGYSVPLSAVAVCNCVAKRKKQEYLWNKISIILELKEEILCKKKVCFIRDYHRRRPDFVCLDREDINLIKESFSLYARGRRALEVMRPKGPRGGRRNGKEHDNYIHKPVLDCLEESAGVPFSQDFLCTLVDSDLSHKLRDLYRTIVIARFRDRKDISYNEDNNTFTFHQGKRAESIGCYRRILWWMLDEKYMRHCGVESLTLTMSNLGYDPIPAEVERLLNLKRFCLNDYDSLSKQLVHRKKIWDVVFLEKKVKSADYYENHPSVDERVCQRDMVLISRLWRLYEYIHNFPEWEKVCMVRKFLEKNRQGVTLDEIKALLLKTTGKLTDPWVYLSRVMSDAAGHIILDAKDMRFSWQEKDMTCVEKSAGLFQDLCNIPEDYNCDQAMCYLYKRGHFQVCFQDVKELLGVLFIVGKRVCYTCVSDVRLEWASLVSGARSIDNLTGDVAGIMQRMVALNNLGVLSQIEQEGAADFESILPKSPVLQCKCQDVYASVAADNLVQEEERCDNKFLKQDVWVSAPLEERDDGMEFLSVFGDEDSDFEPEDYLADMTPPLFSEEGGFVA